MSGNTSGEWRLFWNTVPICIAFLIYLKQLWRRPLNHGHGFFLDVKVPPGFYEGEGIRWLRRWHAVVAAWYVLALFGGAVAVFISGRWFLAPAWAGGIAVVYVAAIKGFTAYARSKLGANPPVISSVAIPLEDRRLRDYISWHSEAVIGAVITFSWIALLVHDSPRHFWEASIIFTYVVIGLVPFKVLIARSIPPLPPDRPDEHFRWIEAQRRYYLRGLDLFRWLFVVLLAGFGVRALLRNWHEPAAWLLWPLCGVFFAVWLYMVVAMIWGERRLDKMGRDLLPVGSWSTPFRPARVMPPGFAKWFGIWFGGLLLLLVFFHY